MVEGIALDSSVVVKWFKEGEDHEGEALELRDRILASSLKVSCSELLPLEVCRGLVKTGFPEDKVTEALSVLEEMAGSGFLRLVPLSQVAKGVGKLIIDLNLYVIDAITLSVSFDGHLDLVTEDRHLLKDKVVSLAKKNGVKLISLNESRTRLRSD